jgi:hypothetical protein
MGEAVSPGSSLLGRESELGVLDRLFDDVHARGGSLEATGGPRAGKPALLAETAARAPVLAVADDAHWLDRPTPCAGIGFLMPPRLDRRHR